jgi:hypothetical protein
MIGPALLPAQKFLVRGNVLADNCRGAQFIGCVPRDPYLQKLWVRRATWQPRSFWVARISFRRVPPPRWRRRICSWARRPRGDQHQARSYINMARETLDEDALDAALPPGGLGGSCTRRDVKYSSAERSQRISSMNDHSDRFTRGGFALGNCGQAAFARRLMRSVRSVATIVSHPETKLLG